MYLCHCLACVGDISLVLHRSQHLCDQIPQKTKADMIVITLYMFMNVGNVRSACGPSSGTDTCE